MSVLDASAAIAWLTVEDGTDQAAGEIAGAMLAGFTAPAIFPLEVANVLWRKLRRNEIDAVYRDAALSRLFELGVGIDPEAQRPEVVRATVRLSEAHRLSCYDAAYLELAVRRSRPLLTLDTALRQAAQAEGVPMLPK